MYNLISLGCGILAWVIPFFALILDSFLRSAPIASVTLCAVSLYYQMLEYERLLTIKDVAALLDTCKGVSFVAAVLLVVTLAENLFLLSRTTGLPLQKAKRRFKT